MGIGLYDNEKGCYVDVPEIKSGIWLVDNNTDQLMILARDDAPTFDTYGGDEDRIDELHATIRENDLSDDDLTDETFLEEQDLTYIWDRQRRFDSASGYYVA